jgi:hypothetical protein
LLYQSDGKEGAGLPNGGQKSPSINQLEHVYEKNLLNGPIEKIAIQET